MTPLLLSNFPSAARSSAAHSYLSDLEELLAPIPTSGPLPDDITDTIEEAEQLLDQLKIHVHALANPTAKAAALAQTKTYTAKVEDLKRRQLLARAPRAGAAGGPADGPVDEDERHAANMERLHAARAQLLQSEDVARDTLERLNQQEETMRRVNANQKEVIAEQKLSDKLLTRMGKWWRG